MKRFVVLALLCLLTGCDEHIESTESPLGTSETEYVTILVFDMSGSFEQLMEQHGYEFALHVLDRNFKGRIGTHDKLIITMISGTQRSMLWEGKAMDLRNEFPSATVFKDFLRKKAPAGSLVHDSIRNAVEYVMSEPQVAAGNAKTSLFVLSDMEDSELNAAESERKLLATLADFARLKTVVGLYFVHQLRVATWRQHLHNAGFRGFRVESEINGKPTLPNFEN